MKLWDAKIAEMILVDIMNGSTKKEAIISGLIVEMAIPWNSTVNVVEIAEIMDKYDNPEDHEWKTFDGVLYCDGTSVGRVGPKERPICDDDLALYWEGRCLNMGYPVD